MPHAGPAYSLYADESATNDRFMAFGGILLPTENVPAAEEFLQDATERRGFGSREISWKNCSRGEVDRYASLAGVLWDLHEGLEVDFRSLVIDTQRTPLRSPEFGCPTAETGFYKFYHHFITASIARIAPTSSNVSICVAATSDQYPYRTEILTSTIGGALKRGLGRQFTVSEIRRGEPKESRIHQLADLLVGAVTHRWNSDRRSPTKAPICTAVEERCGQPLNQDFRPHVRPFNVWHFAPTGTPRWATGSTGTV